MGKDSTSNKNSKDWDHYLRGKSNSQGKDNLREGDTEAMLWYSAEHNTILLHGYTRIRGMPMKSKDSNI